MKVSISNIAWNSAEDKEIAAVLNAAGVLGVDLAPTAIWKNPLETTREQAQAYRAWWAKRGIACVGMQSLLFGHPEFTLFGDDAARITLKDYLSGIIRLAGWLGVGPLVFGSPKNRVRGTLSEADAIRIAVPFFREMGAIAVQHNTVLCVEPNAVEYGCDFVITTAQGIDLVRAVDHPGFRLHLDASIMTMNGENIEQSLEQALPYLAHFHISEPFLGLIGAGGVDHARVGRALCASGYSGWVSIEMKSGLMTPDSEAVRMATQVASEGYGCL